VQTESESPLQTVQHSDTIHPSFPGGESALSAFLKEHITYPYNVNDRPYTGKIKVTLAIAESGKITYYSILNSPNKAISGEIKRVVKLMPDWIPATKNEIAVADSVRIWFPFVYKKE
jgi:protein TonB